MTQRLLPKKEVLKRTALSHSGLYNAISENTFPRQIVLSARRVAWSEKSVEAWIEARIQGKPLTYGCSDNGGAHE